MPNASAPSLVRVVDDLLAELESIHGWIAELKSDLTASDTRRIKLANALEPAERPAYDNRIREMLGDIGPARTGRPPTDDRYETVLQMLAEWPEEMVTTADVRLHLERKRLPDARNYGSNILKRLQKRGLVMRVAYGRYRVTRLHPHLVARRHGVWHRLKQRAAGNGVTAQVRSL